ncbi:acyltransferase family protein [Nocardioides sp. SYSU DS0663]|uniref:acyltransferase family protein n=1 Tax=Nocardioides sp. SYSU DS0663 TaxID=3416445 RepID=UPI003F4C813E
MTTTMSQPVEPVDAVDEAVVTPRFPVLDALRAVGALAVLTTHVAFHAGAYGRGGTVGVLLARLDVGVALFFVLSGFLLSRPYLARAALGRPRPATGRYLAKRLLRIYPVYLVAAVVALTALPANHDLGLRDWVVTLTLATIFVDPLAPAGLGQMWSLGVEATFYLALPAFMLLATGRRRLSPARVAAVLALGVATTIWWHLDGAARAQGATPGPALLWLPGFLSWFAVGIGLALLHVQHARGRGNRVSAAVLALGRQPGVCWALALGLLLAAATPLAGPTSLTVLPTDAESLTKNLLYALVGGLTVLAGIAADPGGRFGRALGSSPARRLGVVSYSVFCLHLILLELIAEAMDYPLFGGNGVQLWVLTVASTLVAAEVAYRLVERPAMRLFRLAPERRSPAAAATAATGTTSR